MFLKGKLFVSDNIWPDFIFSLTATKKKVLIKSGEHTGNKMFYHKQ